MQRQSKTNIFFISMILMTLITMPLTQALNEPPIPTVPTTTINVPPVDEPPITVIPPSTSGLSNAQYELLITQNATLMKKINEFKAELQKYATKSQLAETRLDIFEAVEYNTLPTKTILPYAALTTGLFLFLLFIFGSVESSRILGERMAQGNLRCPNCGKYAKPIKLQKGTVYLCQCKNVYGKLNPKILDHLKEVD